MIASSGYAAYWAGRELFHFVHPWWARVAVLGGLLVVVFGLSFIQQVLEDREAAARRAQFQRRMAELRRTAPSDRQRRIASTLSMMTQDELTHLVRRYPFRPKREPNTDGTCAHWIPEDMR